MGVSGNGERGLTAAPHTSWGKTDVCHLHQLCWGGAPHHPFDEHREHSEGANVSCSPHQTHHTMNNTKNNYNYGRRETKQPVPEQAGGPARTQTAEQKINKRRGKQISPDNNE